MVGVVLLLVSEHDYDRSDSVSRQNIPRLEHFVIGPIQHLLIFPHDKPEINKFQILQTYNIIFFGGLVTIVAMLSLSLDTIMKCKGLQCCCMKEDDEDELEEEEEEEGTSCACLLESEDDDAVDAMVHERERNKPILKK